jgi:hypothetical protein
MFRKNTLLALDTGSLYRLFCDIGSKKELIWGMKKKRKEKKMRVDIEDKFLKRGEILLGPLDVDCYCFLTTNSTEVGRRNVVVTGRFYSTFQPTFYGPLLDLVEMLSPGTRA